MSEHENPVPEHHFVKKEPKFCRCQLCHEHSYAETLNEAQRTCQTHADKEHPDWELSACYCPD